MRATLVPPVDPRTFLCQSTGSVAYCTMTDATARRLKMEPEELRKLNAEANPVRRVGPRGHRGRRSLPVQRRGVVRHRPGAVRRRRRPARLNGRVRGAHLQMPCRSVSPARWGREPRPTLETPADHTIGVIVRRTSTASPLPPCYREPAARRLRRRRGDRGRDHPRQEVAGGSTLDQTWPLTGLDVEGDDSAAQTTR